MTLAFGFVRRLTVDSHVTGMADAQSVHGAGFREAGLFDVISVAGHYSFMTRILEVTASTFMSASWT